MAFGSVGGLMTVPGVVAPAGYFQVSSGSMATAQALPAYTQEAGKGGPKLVLIQAEAQNIRWRDDGTNPSATVGNILVANDILFYTGDFSAFKMIAATAGAIANVTYYR